jgi:hypothetical protein
MESTRMPTVAETIRTHAGLSDLRDPGTQRGLVVTSVILVALAMWIPPLGSVEDPSWFPTLGAFTGVVLGAAHREYRFGGPPRLILVAALTAAALFFVVFALWLGLNAVIGGRLAANPFQSLFALPFELQVAAMVALMIALIAGYFALRPRFRRASERFEAKVREERAKRGLAPP